MNALEIKVPNVGVEGAVEVIEICVSAGDELNIDDPLIVLESDKATVEVPSPTSGIVERVALTQGDKVTEGGLILVMQAGSTEKPKAASDPIIAEDIEPVIETVKDSGEASSAVEHDVIVPDLGDSEQVEVIELVAQVDQVMAQEETLIVLESDKATMEIPTPVAGVLKCFQVSVGDKISSGDIIATVTTRNEAREPGITTPTIEKEAEKASQPEQSIALSSPSHESAPVGALDKRNTQVHAGPSIRKYARELSVDLSLVAATGPRSRILKEDLNQYIKHQVQTAQNLSSGQVSNNGLPTLQLPDFSKFGEIDVVAMDKIQRITAENMLKSWLNVPHVTQFDEADITEMELFRKQQKSVGESKGVKLTPMAFILKACAFSMEVLPQFNVSLNMQDNQFIQKKYIHIGFAVDTPNGLVVPVIRDVNKKSLWQLAQECQELASKARDKKLLPSDMQGGCFTISSLGGLGGTSFTPIVNTPEVAILGVSKAQFQPKLNDKGDFIPRLMLPLSLSYDHRAVNGADAARFTSMLGKVLSDLRELLL